jgi:membrane protein implicated in regulation of membrane protease activity
MATRLVRIIGESFWLLALGAITIFAFFALLGALDPGDVVGITVVMGVLAVLFVARTFARRRHAEEIAMEGRKTHERERRGF